MMDVVVLTLRSNVRITAGEKRKCCSLDTFLLPSLGLCHKHTDNSKNAKAWAVTTH